MQFEELKNVPLFTPLTKVFEAVGEPKFKLGSLPIYYMGGGYFIAFSERVFHVEDGQRIETGEPGEYALKSAFFREEAHAKTYYRAFTGEWELESEEVLNDKNVELFEGIDSTSTLKQVTGILRKRRSSGFYREGENRALVNGEFTFTHQFIYFCNFEMFFFGKSKQTPMGGFQFIFR